MVYFTYLGAVVLVGLGIAHFHVYSQADFWAAAAIWCSGYLMSQVFE